MIDPTLPAEARRIELLRRSGLLEGSPMPELEDICARAQGYFGTAVALVTLIDADRQVMRAAAGTDLREMPRSAAFCDHTIRSDGVLVVRDARADPRFAGNPVVTGAPFIRFYAGAPLIYLDGYRLGSVCLLDPEPRDFSPLEEADLALTAEQVVGLLIAREYATNFA